MSLLPSVDVPRALARGAGFFSFIIGLGIAVMLFHRPFSIEPILAVPMDQIQNAVGRHDGKCYRYRVEDASCHFSSSL